MPARFEQGETVWILRLEGEMNIGCAAEFKNLLTEALASGKEIRLDLQNATDLDITALQLLWAAQREAKGSGRRFVLAGQVPESLMLTSKDVGFEKFPGPDAVQ
jgi:anti-anti-sigma factor